MAQRQLKLGAFMRPVSIHTGAWRYPGAYPDANFNFAHSEALRADAGGGKFDAFFMADHLAVLNMPVEALKRSHTVTSFEPFTLLSALAAVTERIGLVATGSTTFDEPYHVARRFASLDHLSGGRAGWNIVTTSNPDAALNFGLDDHMEHGERYERAREFYDVVTGSGTASPTTHSCATWRAACSSIPAKMHVLDHKGESVGARTAEHRPAGPGLAGDRAGRRFGGGPPARGRDSGGRVHRRRHLADGAAFYADMKGRMEKVGRDPDHLKILPGAFVVVGDTVEEAQQEARASSTASCTTRAPSPRCRSRSATTPPASIRTRRCRRSRRPTPARADASA